MQQRLHKLWQEQHWWQYLLLPLMWLYQAVVFLRKPNQSEKPPVPVIVVGNITVGGTGKTPTLIAIADYLKSHGYQPGIISRGYGGKATSYPQIVSDKADPAVVGDEACLIRQRTACPMVVDPNRKRALDTLLNQFSCDVVLSDDGLQHHALPRSVEIVVIDGEREFGNGWCLPLGPLREPLSRLNNVDFVIRNGGKPQVGEYGMHLQPQGFYSVATAQAVELAPANVHAVAGIGNPGRFFSALSGMGFEIESYTYADHHAYTADDVIQFAGRTVVMTEKDAVKWRAFAGEQHYYLQVAAEIDEAFFKALRSVIARRP